MQKSVERIEYYFSAYLLECCIHNFGHHCRLRQYYLDSSLKPINEKIEKSGIVPLTHSSDSENQERP